MGKGIKAGDMVSWESQAHGSWVKKTGKVIAIVPAGESAMQYAPADAQKSHIRFQDVSGIDRVLIRVMAGKDKNIAHYYCPYHGVLTVVPQTEKED